jgi:hypothetical protein
MNDPEFLPIEGRAVAETLNDVSVLDAMGEDVAKSLVKNLMQLLGRHLNGILGSTNYSHEDDRGKDMPGPKSESGKLLSSVVEGLHRGFGC